jgi:hypothetical protein
MAGAGNREGCGVDGSEHVEIHEAVVERGDQRVGHRECEPHQVGVGGRRVDDQEVVRVLDGVDGGREIVELDRLVVGDDDALGAGDAEMRWNAEVELGVLGPGAAVLDVVAEAFLARVEIDGGHALAGLHQRDRDMHRNRGLARSALLIAEHDDMGGVRPHATLYRHGTPREAESSVCPRLRSSLARDFDTFTINLNHGHKVR